MRAPKPQVWSREYAGGLVMRIATDAGGPWRVTGDIGSTGWPWRAYPLASVKIRAGTRAGAHGVSSWRRVCQRCDAPMTLDARNRPDSGPQFLPDFLWVCTARSCRHAEPADD